MNPSIRRCANLGVTYDLPFRTSRTALVSSEPADFFGLRDRGQLAAGMAADIVLFDYHTIGSGKRPEMRYDLPGGGRRLVMPAHGVHSTIVNGAVLYEDGKHTGALPGQVLRSGS